MRSTLRRAPRGTSMIEAMVAMGVLLVGLLGFASLQVVTVRANHYNKRVSQASALANDLVENVRLWGYLDTRLTSLGNVTSAEAAAVKDKWDMGRAQAASYTAQYGDAPDDANATNQNALGATYPGIKGELDPYHDGPEFFRYWNVFGLDTDGDGNPNGKLVQVIVRWKEPAYGYRQITTMAFKPDPQAMLQ